jgi:hypothetical protein
VQLFWNAMAGANGYQAQGRKVGTSSFKQFKTYATNRTVSSLLPGTSYEWQIRMRCTDGSISTFSPLSTFTMPALREYASQQNEKQPLTQLALFPNPVVSGGSLLVENACAGCLLQLSDPLGRIRWSVTLDGENGALILPDLADGLYFLQVENKNPQRLYVHGAEH